MQAKWIRFMNYKLLLLSLGLTITGLVHAQVSSRFTWDTIVVNAPLIINKGTHVVSYDFYTNDSTERIVSASPVEFDKTNRTCKKLAGPFKSLSTFRNQCEDTMLIMCKQSFNYTLQFNQEGKFVFPEFCIKTTSGQTVVSKPYEIYVANDSVDLKSKKILFVEPTVSNINPSVGDTILYELRIVTNITSADAISVLKVKKTGEEGQWYKWEPLESFIQNSLYEGMPVSTKVVYQAKIAPLQKGRQDISSEVTLRIPKKQQNRSIFDSFFSDTKDTTIQVTPIELIVD